MEDLFITKDRMSKLMMSLLSLKKFSCQIFDDSIYFYLETYFLVLHVFHRI